VRAVQQPLTVAGQPCHVAAAVGLALYPEHGKDAASLLRRAQAQAGSLLVGGGQAGAPGVVRSGGAANDAG
jgi:predicted signal transduction protein with EAL and GGDEF domain